MPDEVVLDRNSFKALASEVRVGLLKRLDKGRRTASQLAEEFSLSVQAVSEHLKKLEEAGLVGRRDEGRKWVYYELTQKGLRVIGKGKSNVLFLLSLSFLMLATGVGMAAFNSLGSYSNSPLLATESMPVLNGTAVASKSLPVLQDVAPNAASGLGQAPQPVAATEIRDERVIATAKSNETVVTVTENRAAEIGWFETVLIVVGTFLLAFSAKKMLATKK